MKTPSLNSTATFTPITVTAETLSMLSKEKNYANLLALYMACVEMTVWQGTNNIKATAGFMMKRLKWGEDKLIASKGRLVELGLLEPIVRRERGKVMGHYTLVKHVINQNPPKPSPGFHHALVSEGTSTNELKESTNKKKKAIFDSTSSFGAVANQNSPISAPATALLEKLIGIVNPNEKVTDERIRMLNGRLKNYTEQEVIESATAFSKSVWHKENKRMSIDYLLMPSKFGQWYAQRIPEEKGYVPPTEAEQKAEEDRLAALRKDMLDVTQ